MADARKVIVALGISLLGTVFGPTTSMSYEPSPAASSSEHLDQFVWPRGTARSARRVSWVQLGYSASSVDTTVAARSRALIAPRAWANPVAASRVSADMLAMVGQGLPGCDGNVVAAARSGNTLYIAGSFRSVGENSGGLALVDDHTGMPLRSFPKVAGSVATIIPDGLGGWYIGGDFSSVDGRPRSCLAQIRLDGSVSDWNPEVSGSPAYIDPPTVLTLARYGERLFVGGAFRSLGGESHENLACVDTRTGGVLPWNISTNIDEPIFSLVMHADTVLVAGKFSSIGGTPRGSLAAVSAATGAVLPWQVDLFGGAKTLLASGDTLYVGGEFTDVGGQTAPKLTAVSISRAQRLPIDFRVNGVFRPYLPLIQVDGLAIANDTLYAVGNFTTIGGRPRAGIAALDARTGDALDWAPDSTGPRAPDDPPPTCTTAAVHGQSLYVSGYFETVGGVHHPLIAAWDRRSGHVLDWRPAPDAAIAAIASTGDSVYLGGYFHLISDWQHRAGLAAVDLATGKLKPWNPNPNGGICTAIAVSNGHVLVSGDFSVIGGIPLPRAYLAALDTLNGEAADWDPGSNSVAEAYLVAGDTLFLGGEFTQVGGLVRNGAAAIDIKTGEVLPWDPNVNEPVLALAMSGDAVFLGGLFTEVGSMQRLGVAAVDRQVGMPSRWNPGTDNSAVYALAMGDGVVYVGGAFGVIGGQSRRSLAAVDIQTGLVTPWAPMLTEWNVVDPRVQAMTMIDSVLYVGGSFASLAGQARVCLGGVDVRTGEATAWDPGTDGLVWSLVSSGNTLYVGGGFSRAGGLPASGLAAFLSASAPPLFSTTLQLAACIPNPVSTTAIIPFSLPAPAMASLSVYDLQGRRVGEPLRGGYLNPGRHSVLVDTRGWSPGVYLCSLEAGGQTKTRKLLVIR